MFCLQGFYERLFIWQVDTYKEITVKKMISVDKEEFHYKYNAGCINQNSESLSVRLLGYVETFSLVSLLLIGVLLA